MDHWFVVYDDDTAEGWWAWSAVKLRGPVKFGVTADGGLIPVVRGARRSQILEEVGHLLDALGPFQPENPDVPTAGTFDGVRTADRRGRKPGKGPDPEATRATMARVRRECPQLSVTDAWGVVADEVGLSHDTVKDHLYRQPRERVDPGSPRRQPDLVQRCDRLSHDLAASKRRVDLAIDALDALEPASDDHRLRIERQRAELVGWRRAIAVMHAEHREITAIYNGCYVYDTVRLLRERGYDDVAILNALADFPMDAAETLALYELGQSHREALTSREVGASTYVSRQWLMKVERRIATQARPEPSR